MELSINDFVMLALGGSCVLVLLCTIVSRTLHARSERKSLAHRVICRLCLHAFEESNQGEIVHCPQCHAANEKGRSRRLG